MFTSVKYESPSVSVFNLLTEGVLCSSGMGSNEDYTVGGIDPDDDGWE